MITENLSTLKIHKLTQEQYNRELAAGNIDENAIYLTPDEEIDLSGYALKEELNSKADTEHSHDDIYYTETEIDAKISEVNASIANITTGDVVVKNAEHSSTADIAENAEKAEHATSADEAIKATQDASGNVITEVYETKADAQAKLDEAKAHTDEQIENHVHSWNDLEDKPFGSYYKKDVIAALDLVEAGWNGSHIQTPYAYESNRQAPDSIQMVVMDGGWWDSTIFDQILQKQYKVANFGGFWSGFWWYGNLNLITSELDREAKFAIDDLNLTEIKYSDVPFVYYGYTYEVYGEIGTNTSLDGFKIIFSDDLTPSNNMIGYCINIYDASSEGELVYKTISENYIPDSITRTSDIITKANQNSLDTNYSPTNPSDIVTKEYVDSNILTSDDAVVLLTETGFVEPASNNGYVFTNEDNVIYTF